MPGPRKYITVTHHGPLGLPGAVVGWEDVWLRLYVGRRSVRLAPCLCSKVALLSDLGMARELSVRTKFEDNLRLGLAWTEDREKASREYHKVEASRLQKLLVDVETNGITIDAPPPTHLPVKRDFGLANVYTNKDEIDLTEAERMLDAYLLLLDVHRATYKWKNTCGIVVWPTTIDPKHFSNTLRS